MEMQQIVCESVTFHISIHIFQIQTTCYVCSFLMFRPLIDIIDCSFVVGLIEIYHLSTSSFRYQFYEAVVHITCENGIWGVFQGVEMRQTVCGCIDLGWLPRRGIIFKEPIHEVPTTY